MKTQLSSHQRVHREARLEAAHHQPAFSDASAVHLDARTSTGTTYVPYHEQASTVSGTRIATRILQIAKTAIPLLVLDYCGLSLGILIASMSVTALFSQVPASLAMTPQLFSNGLVFILIYALLGLYPGAGVNPIVELKSMILGTLTAGLILAVFSLAFDHESVPHLAFVGALTGFALVFAPLFRCSARALLANCPWWGQPVLLIGNRESTEKLLKVLNQKSTLGLRPVGIVPDQYQIHSRDFDNSHVLGTLADIPALANEHRVFWALISPSDRRTDSFTQSVNYCHSIPNVVVIPGLEEFPSLWNRTQDFGGVLGISYRARLLDPWSQIFKRAFDLIAVILGVLLLSPFLLPLLAFTWACMKVYSPGPIFYGQERVGKNGAIFKAWKFRTMVLNADAALTDYLQKHPEKRLEWDVNQKLRQDPRVIPGIGTLLRKSSLDELPQLWNVLCGEMSLVGPRPFMTEQTQIYGDRLALYGKVRPGITGLWQISGRNHTTFEERGKFDAYYVRNWSFWLDLFILGRTVKTVLFREGAF
ncbi:undecaprenyl-phosphate galactose phosphotransferase WbaP [Planctomicrobium sp. SH661]|uniref:undecaprenyl-phosphate galactose phosphotransferase WbaP n=1 Tax=Planctomicrobium sp. SH661 TaxID=3448124 RepID=UPI003F5B3421